MNPLLACLAGTFLLSLAGIGGSVLWPWTVLFVFSALVLARLLRRSGRDGQPWFERRPKMTLFWLCLAVYLSTFRWHGGDDIPNSLLPYCILGHGTLSFDPFASWADRPDMNDLVKFVHGHWYSTYPVASGVLATPLYIISALFRVPPTDVFLHNLAKISGAVFTAFSAVAVLAILERRCSRRWAMAVALLYAFGSYAFSVSGQALYSHGPAQLGVALGLLGLLSQSASGALLSGFGFGLASAAREDSVFFLAAAGLFFLFHRRDGLPRFLAGAAVPLGLNLAYWYAATGRPQPPYFGVHAGQFSALSVRALSAMLFSPARGLACFFPAAAFAFFGAGRWRSDPRRRWIAYYLAACVALWVFYGFRTTWTGGNTFGNRYFAVVCLILALFCAEAEERVRGSARLRWAWAAAFAFCVAVHAVGAYFNWPGAQLTLPQQDAELWSLRQFPLAALFTAQGALGGLGAAKRGAAASGILGLTVPLAVWMHRLIRPVPPPVSK
jgi:hypothetical protein